MLKELFESAEGPIAAAGDVAAPAFSVDARTNCVLAIGNAETLQVIEAILLRIDQPIESVVTTDSTSSRVDITPRTPAEQKIQRALQAPGFIGGEDRAVYDVLRMLADRHDIPLYFDQTALEDVRLEEIEIPLVVSDASVASILDLLLRQVPAREDGSRQQDFNSSGLTYFVQDDVLVITTREVAEKTMQLRTYDLRPLQNGGQALHRAVVVEAIRTMTDESTWTDQGGRGTIIEGNSTLTIRQSPLVHREIESLFEQLLHAAEATAESAK
jgi:hypothetical protein